MPPFHTNFNFWLSLELSVLISACCVCWGSISCRVPSAVVLVLPGAALTRWLTLISTLQENDLL